MKRTTLLVLVNSSAFAQAAPYWIKVNSKPTGPYTVQVEVRTNLPDSLVLSAELSLTNQKPDDVFVGTDFQRFSPKNGYAKFSIDGKKRVLPPESLLPSGKYNVVISLYLGWVENRNLVSKLGIKKPIVQMSTVKLVGGGDQAKVIQKKQEGQRWVMANIDGTSDWEPERLLQRFGLYDEYLMSGTTENSYIRMYYFSSIDMTFMVNVEKGKVVTWRMGKVLK